MMSFNRAVFAVVGHPNKGKSSIVSTLCQDDSVKVSSRSGTTDSANRYRVETEHSGYELVDTPGFQRPGAVLKWLQKRATSADQRAEAVAEFVADPECQNRFPDEVALLKPIINGAAILYVVDGSRPYGAEYESEMEVLRWTGQPSMALINPIENESHVAQWESALTQYFKTVRVFNPMTADFDKQIALLNTFVHLQPAWSENLSIVTKELITQREQQKWASAVILSRLIEDLCYYTESQKVLNQKQAESLKPLLAKRYKEWMSARERKAVEELLTVYQHYQTQYEIADFDLPPDLFDQQKWFIWGLDKKQLASAATVAGAVAGGAIDLAVAGHSLMLGALGGGIAGFSSAWFGADKLADLKIKGLPVGGYLACYGPMKNPNFPYVILGRMLHIYSQVSQLNHANRSTLSFTESDFKSRLNELEKSQQNQLHQACRRVIQQKSVDNFAQLILPILS